jgi:hypothetical protein
MQKFTFNALPSSAIQFEGINEPFVLCLGPPLPLFCDRVRLPHLQITIKIMLFLSPQIKRQIHEQLTFITVSSPEEFISIFPEEKTKNRSVGNWSLCHLELRSSTNKTAPPSVSPAKR